MLRKLSINFITGIYIEMALTTERCILSCNLQTHPPSTFIIFRPKTPDMDIFGQGGDFLLLLRLTAAPAVI